MNRAQGIDFMTYSKGDFLTIHKEVTPAEYAEANKAYKEWKAADNAEQSKDYGEWFELIKKCWGQDMWDYFKKDTARVVKLDCGRYIEIKKPRIHTEFCFGYHTYDDSSNGAERMAQHVTEDGGDYFIRENLKDVNDRISEYDGTDEWITFRGQKAYSFGGHWGEGETRLGYINFINPAVWYDHVNEKEWATAIPLTENDIQKMLKAYKLVKLDFMKRLNTYLKKYGTSKLHTWTYWMDE